MAIHPIHSLQVLIPPITHPMGKSWSQPSLNQMEITEDGYVVMPKKTFNMLADYSTTMPSGVYPGKMWKAQWDGSWHLCWYGIIIRDAVEDTTKCSINHRPIILKEMLDLLESNT